MDIAKVRKKREKLGIYVPRLARVSLSVEGIALGALAPWRQKLSLFRTKAAIFFWFIFEDKVLKFEGIEAEGKPRVNERQIFSLGFH
ncbi:hypothetical protein DY000_02056746 [Brassica cretica]|uniref:Uncharacterized protein n=1 Tax=Brassica cretica TaxID=69181 RepID=A0ABQ7A9D2_BRACR|nr:hypothetical protein DY000_02056746 [Brassica cretica]